MKRVAVLVTVALALAVSAFAGFKVKLVKPKKPEQFQARTTVAGVTYAADLLLDGKDQKDYFYKELTPSDVIAVRLAVFNRSKEEVQLTGEVTLSTPDGSEAPLIAADTVAEAVLQGLVVSAQSKKKKETATTAQGADPRINPNDPRIGGDPPVVVDPGDPRGRDPRMDPRSRDPRMDPRTDPRYDPSDPRYDPNDPRYGRSGGGWGVPTVILNPGGGRGGDLTQFESQLAKKDFEDKSHSTDPIEPPSTRDRFLYFSLKDRPPTTRGFVLRLPKSKGIPDDVILKF